MITTRQATRDAREYLHTVKDTFQNNREIYDTFLKLLKDFHSKRIGHRVVRSKVIELFKGHQDLILGFNKFVPKCFKIILRSDGTLKTPDFREALNFVNKVKARLQDDRAHKSFVEIFKMYTEERKSVTEVFREVVAILRDHPDLCMEFAYFLPRYRRV